MVKKLSMYVGPHDVYPTIYFLFKLCFAINVLNYKTIIALKLA